MTGSAYVVNFLCGSDSTPTPAQWLWTGYLVCGKLAILAGAAGTGKTSVAIDLGARLSVGAPWPDGSPAPVGNVLILSSEDDFRDTILPRFIAAGGDRARFHTIVDVVDPKGRRSFDAREDIARLDEFFVKHPGPTLLIIDPITSVVGGDDHKNAQVRHALQPLLDLAERRGCAVLGISHFTKGTTGADPLERVTGSLAFGAVPRVVLVAAKNHSTEGPPRVLTRAKVSIGADGGGFAYDVVGTHIAEPAEIATSKIKWGESLDGSARAIVAMVETTSEEVSREGAVVRWLREFLVVPRTADEVYKAADAEGYSQSSIARASRKLDVKKMKRGMVGGWDWRLPDKNPSAPAKVEDVEGAEEVTFQSLTSSVSSASTEEFEARTERVAIMEFDGRLPRYEAEKRASGLKPAAAYFRTLRDNGTRVTEVQSDSSNSVRR
jgi:putative DNA primase/helicase